VPSIGTVESPAAESGALYSYTVSDSQIRSPARVKLGPTARQASKPCQLWQGAKGAKGSMLEPKPTRALFSTHHRLPLPQLWRSTNEICQRRLNHRRQHRGDEGDRSPLLFFYSSIVSCAASGWIISPRAKNFVRLAALAIIIPPPANLDSIPRQSVRLKPCRQGKWLGFNLAALFLWRARTFNLIPSQIPVNHY
jgi:hypothetical protein